MDGVPSRVEHRADHQLGRHAVARDHGPVALEHGREGPELASALLVGLLFLAAQRRHHAPHVAGSRRRDGIVAFCRDSDAQLGQGRCALGRLLREVVALHLGQAVLEIQAAAPDLVLRVGRARRERLLRGELGRDVGRRQHEHGGLRGRGRARGSPQGGQARRDRDRQHEPDPLGRAWRR